MVKEVLAREAFRKTMHEFWLNGADYETIGINESLLVSILTKFDDREIEELIEKLSVEYYQLSEQIVGKLSPGLASSIRTDKGLQTEVYGGFISDDSSTKIDENTRFDLASISKLFFIIAVMEEQKKYQEERKIDIYKTIAGCNSTYANLKVRIVDALRFDYELKTTMRIDEKTQSGEFTHTTEEIINSILPLTEIEKKEFTYSDIPHIIISQMFPYKQIFNALFIQQLGMKQTGFNPDADVITTGGNITNLHLVHDSKCQTLGGFSGHAGVFSTATDLLKLQKLIGWLINYNPELYNEIIRKRSLDEHNKGNKMGMMYIKHPKSLAITEVSEFASLKSIASTGFTGTWALYDPMNHFAANFLTNPLSTKSGEKPKTYVYMMDEYKRAISTTAFCLRVLEKYLEYTRGLKEFDKPKIACKKLKKRS